MPVAIKPWPSQALVASAASSWTQRWRISARPPVAGEAALRAAVRPLCSARADTDRTKV
jgi:hypothetical protein